MSVIVVIFLIKKEFSEKIKLYQGLIWNKMGVQNLISKYQGNLGKKMNLICKNKIYEKTTDAILKGMWRSTMVLVLVQC